MSLIQLAEELQLNPKRTAATNGGEYHSPCPNCGGKDRFIIWEQANRYFCRQCEAKGDGIQFCRDFMGLSYQEACSKLNIEQSRKPSRKETGKPIFSPLIASQPSPQWQEKSNEFVAESLHALMKEEKALQSLYERGFSQGNIKKFSIGWNSEDKFYPLPTWGLPNAWNEENREKKLWLPKGIVIPTFIQQSVIKLKIRRHDWQESDSLPKYVEISGSMKCPSIYGNIETQVIVILESELDAMLVQQYASDICASMAIGGVGKKPDLNTDAYLKKALLILFALDFDEAGKKAYPFWRSAYPQLRAWPIPKGKSPGDALKLGVDLRKWILDGINHPRLPNKH
jgi:DNA primase